MLHGEVSRPFWNIWNLSWSQSSIPMENQQITPKKMSSSWVASPNDKLVALGFCGLVWKLNGKTSHFMFLFSRCSLFSHGNSRGYTIYHIFRQSLTTAKKIPVAYPTIWTRRRYVYLLGSVTSYLDVEGLLGHDMMSVFLSTLHTIPWSLSSFTYI